MNPASPPLASSSCFPPACQIASRRMFNFRPKHEYGGMGRGRGFTLLPLYHSLHGKSPPPLRPFLGRLVHFIPSALLQVRLSVQPPLPPSLTSVLMSPLPPSSLSLAKENALITTFAPENLGSAARSSFLPPSPFLTSLEPDSEREREIVYVCGSEHS